METNSINQALLEDIWQKIPSEEKKQVASQAQSNAISAIVVLIMFGWAMAIGMREQWFFWGTFLVVPFAFQVATSKAWHARKPKLIVEYAAARATASYYAQQVTGERRSPSLQFKGLLERPFEANVQMEHELSHETPEEPTGPVPVWVTLFPDCVVMFSETPFGSRREFAHSIFEDLSASSESPDEDFGGQKRLTISVRDETGVEHLWVLTSKHSAHLSACERKLLQAIERRNTLAEEASLASQHSLRHEAASSLDAQPVIDSSPSAP